MTDDRRTLPDLLAAAGVALFGVGLAVLVVVVVGDLGLGADLPGWVVATPWLLMPPGFALGLAGLVAAAIARRRR